MNIKLEIKISNTTLDYTDPAKNVTQIGKILFAQYQPSMVAADFSTVAEKFIHGSFTRSI